MMVPWACRFVAVLIIAPSRRRVMVMTCSIIGPVVAQPGTRRLLVGVTSVSDRVLGKIETLWDQLTNVDQLAMILDRHIVTDKIF